MSLLVAMSKAAGAVVAAGLGLVGLGYGGLGGEDNSTRDEAGQVVDGGEVGAFRIRIGDCFQDPDSGSDEFESVEAVPCTQAHDNEAYAAFNLSGNDYPGVSEVQQLADQGCFDRFAGFVGVEYEDSSFDFWSMYPTEGSWDQLDDREILCAVYNNDLTRATGTARNSAR